jgi:hypothetical protein
MICSRFRELARRYGKTVPCGARFGAAHVNIFNNFPKSSHQDVSLAIPTQSWFESLGVKFEIIQSQRDLKDTMKKEKRAIFNTSGTSHPPVQDFSKLFMLDFGRCNVVECTLKPRGQPRKYYSSNHFLQISSTFSWCYPTTLRLQYFLPLTPQKSIGLPENLRQKRFFTASTDDKTRDENSIVDNRTKSTTSDHHKKDEPTGSLPPIQEFVDSTVETVRPIVESAEMNIRKAADIVRLQDLGTLYGVVLLVFLVLTTPFVTRYVPPIRNRA